MSMSSIVVKAGLESSSSTRVCSSNSKTSAIDKTFSVLVFAMDVSSWLSLDGFQSKRDCPRIDNPDSFITRVGSLKAVSAVLLLVHAKLSYYVPGRPNFFWFLKKKIRAVQNPKIRLRSLA